MTIGLDRHPEDFPRSQECRRCWLILLIPVAYLCVDLTAGPMSWFTGIDWGLNWLGFILYHVMPIIPPVAFILALACQRWISFVVLGLFLTAMVIIWFIDLYGVLSFELWGMSFHSGDLIE